MIVPKLTWEMSFKQSHQLTNIGSRSRCRFVKLDTRLRAKIPTIATLLIWPPELKAALRVTRQFLLKSYSASSTRNSKFWGPSHIFWTVSSKIWFSASWKDQAYLFANLTNLLIDWCWCSNVSKDTNTSLCRNEPNHSKEVKDCRLSASCMPNNRSIRAIPYCQMTSDKAAEAKGVPSWYV